MSDSCDDYGYSPLIDILGGYDSRTVPNIAPKELPPRPTNSWQAKRRRLRSLLMRSRVPCPPAESLVAAPERPQAAPEPLPVVRRIFWVPS